MNKPNVKRVRVPVHGVLLLLDKPVGWSSNDALIRAKRLLNAQKAGHTGTLDPFATGLLPLCFGEATKFSQDLLEADKPMKPPCIWVSPRPPVILKVKCWNNAS
jgi:tRNA pseudouridine55 synthase